MLGYQHSQFFATNKEQTLTVPLRTKGGQSMRVSKTESTKLELAATPINVTQLCKELTKYPKTIEAEYLTNGFNNGFALHYEGPRMAFEAKNLKSAIQNPNIVRLKIKKELQAGRIAGPFTISPFKDLRVSPLGLVPKKEPGEFRLIHHLSYPEGESVNDYIDPKLCSVQYTKFDAAVQMVQHLGQGALLGKADIKSAFRLIPVSKDDFPLLGFKFDNLYYFDKALPFGCSISCAVFEKFATFLEWIVRKSCNVGDLEHYLDDYLFGGEKKTNHCTVMMETFFKLCQSLGVPIADEKTEGPTTILVF